MTRIYRLSLRLLPVDLRDKHGSAMEEMFMRELANARSRGVLSAVLAGTAGVWDVVKRAMYEWGRPTPNASGPQPTPAQLLRRHATSFSVAFVALTASLLVLYGNRQVPLLNARGASAGDIAQLMLLAVPFTAAMTIPMAVFLSVLHEFTKLGARGALASATTGVRRLVFSVLGAAAGVAALSLVLTTEIVPRTNARLTGVMSGGTVTKSDRTMTIGELREAKRNVGPSVEPVSLARAASYEVEIQKKFAIPAACLVLALVGMVIAFSFPRGGAWLVLAASVMVFGACYALLMTGETLAERLVVSPAVGMWSANAVLLTIALLVVWQRKHARPGSNEGTGVETLESALIRSRDRVRNAT